MIVVKQKILARVGDQQMIIPKGSYKKVPNILKADKDFLHFVYNGQIEGYEMTAQEKKDYKPLTKAESVRSIKVYDAGADENFALNNKKEKVDDEKEVDYAAMKVDELKAYAIDNELDIKDLKKPEILVLVLAHVEALKKVNDPTPEELEAIELAKKAAGKNDNKV